MTNLFKYWVETLFISLLILGFILSFVSASPWINFSVIFIAGLAAGRMLYQGRKNIKLPTTLIVIGFILGFVFGTRYGNWKGIVFMFVLGTVISHYIHKKGYLKI